MVAVRKLTVENFMLEARAELELPERGLVVITAPNGCLHGDTLIHDPVDTTTLSVRERYQRGTGFHVWAMGPHGPVVTAACPPTKYPQHALLRVHLSNKSGFVATPNHLVWDGAAWISVGQLYQRQHDGVRTPPVPVHCDTDETPRSSSYAAGLAPLACRDPAEYVPDQLPTIEDTDLRALAQDALRWSQTTPGSLVDCPPGLRSDDAQPPQTPGTAPSISQKPDDAPARSHSHPPGDVSELSAAHSHLCPRVDRRAKTHSAPSEHLGDELSLRRDESQPQPCRRTIEEQPQLPSTSFPPRTAAELSDNDLVSTTPSAALCASLTSSEWCNSKGPIPQDRVQVLEITLVSPDHYFDFHVPVYHNYWACGVFHHNSGKSRVIDAVAQAVWGKTLRGTKGWLDGGGEITLQDAGECTITRTPRTLSVGSVAYDTPAKGAEDLRRRYGVFGLWRHAQVFSSSDGKQFAEATDLQRKQLLEAIAQLEMFDTAVKACRVDLRAVQAEVVRIQNRVAVLRERVTATDRAAGEAPEKPDETRLRATAQKVSTLDAEAQELRAQMRELRGRTGEYTATGREAAARRDRLAADNCPTCEQSIVGAVRDQLQQTIAEQLREAREGLARARATAETAQARLLDVERELSTARQQEATLRAQLAAHARYADTRARNRSTRAEALVEWDDLEEDLALYVDEVKDLEVVERVLGIRGPRAQITRRGLGELQTRTNDRLAALTAGGKPIRIGLSSYTENKTGGVRDAIALTIDGAGGGQGYWACSKGERRRINAAFAIALSDMVRDRQATLGGGGTSTLWADEITEGLDAGGVAAVGSMLERLAETRCVVMISHDPDLVGSVAAVRHYTMAQGQCTRVG